VLTEERGGKRETGRKASRVDEDLTDCTKKKFINPIRGREKKDGGILKCGGEKKKQRDESLCHSTKKNLGEPTERGEKREHWLNCKEGKKRGICFCPAKITVKKRRGKEEFPSPYRDSESMLLRKGGREI